MADTRDVAQDTLPKFNPYHDRRGRFASGRGTGLDGADAVRYGHLPTNTRPGWEDDLTPDERGAFNSYTQSGWQTLNAQLRDGETLTLANQRLAEQLDAGIAKAGAFAEPVTVYRGIKIGDRAIVGHGAALAGRSKAEYEELVDGLTADWAQREFKPGSVFESRGFQSTSFSILPALDASLDKRTAGLLFEVRAKRGAYLDHAKGLSTRDDEYELLLPRSTRYRVLGVLRRVTFEDDYERRAYRTVVQVEQL